MFTRKDYLDSNCTHEQYYSQFVNDQIKAIVSTFFGTKELKNAYAKDPSFNTIPLQQWDNLTYRFSCDKALKERGDYSTLAGKVCILKQAARMIVNG